MNRDEILKMDNRELKLAVAKHVMGIAVNDGIPCKHPGCTQHVSRPCEGCGRYHPILIPDYPSDIAAAWDVVEMMRNKVIYKYPVCPNIIYHHTDGLWHCEYFSGDWMRNATAPTAPLAICRAALLAVMEFDG